LGLVLLLLLLLLAVEHLLEELELCVYGGKEDKESGQEGEDESGHFEK
jgi:hypothetical protein